jgi:transcriptional regulator with XRE-family HTH domain
LCLYYREISLNIGDVKYIYHEEIILKVGQNLKKIRTEKGISQELLSFKTHISTNQIGRIERGEINTSISTLFEISKALEIDIKYFFD